MEKINATTEAKTSAVLTVLKAGVGIATDKTVDDRPRLPAKSSYDNDES